MRRLAQQLRSVVVFQEESDSGELSPSPEDLARFVRAWDEWYRASLGIRPGVNLQLLYRREISLAGLLKLDALSRLGPLAHHCSEAGVALSVTLDLAELVARREALRAILERGLFQGVSLEHLGAAVDAETCAAVVNAIAAEGVSVTMTGAIDDLLATKLLADATMNSRHVQLRQRRQRAPDSAPVLPDPCWRRMAVFVDARGEIYPCAGLVGISAVRLGTLTGFDPRQFDQRVSSDDLGRWALSGPSPDELAPPPAGPAGLWPICESHRDALISVGEIPLRREN